MAYVKANTTPQFGTRAQALGFYLDSQFPLPTSGLSVPWTPAGPPARAFGNQSAISYNITPAGQYQLSPAAILPRGAWANNPSTRGAAPAKSCLGVPISSHGTSLVQGKGRGGMLMQSSPAKGCGGACGCAGKKKNKGLGWLLGDGDTCSFDSDCPAGQVCGGDTCISLDGTTPVVTPSAPVRVAAPAPPAASLQQIINSIAPPVVRPVAPPQTPSWFSQSAIPGIPNPVLAGAAVAILAAMAGDHKR